MPDSLPTPVNRSKLYQPRDGQGLIVRQRLLDANPVDIGGTATLVSAPPGYGKSTFASQIISASGASCAWLSLDAADSDLRRFLSYVVAALHTVFPESCPGTVSCLRKPALPPTEELAGILCNDIDQLKEPVILALDDYYQISALEVHELVNTVLRHTPRNLHLIIVTRRDPPLMLQVFRANGTLTEVRMQQLAFTESDSKEFIRRNLGDEVSEKAIKNLHQRTEGWPAALRLAMLAVPDNLKVDTFVDSLPGDIHIVREYLLHEVLAKCRPSVREYLLRTSFLDGFCASLCEAVSPASEDSGLRTSATLSGDDFIDRIRETGLFTIALDNERKWFRYHHLFQRMLQDHARSEFGEDNIRDIRMLASKWFEDRSMFEEAIQYSLEGDGPTAAATLMCRHRNMIMNLEQWQRLDSWLALLPQQIVDSDPDMLILQARSQDNRGLFEDSWVTVDKLEQLLESQQIAQPRNQQLLGSVEALRCYKHYVFSDGEKAIESAQNALQWLPEDSAAERGFAKMVLAPALQLVGKGKQARKIALEETRNATGSYRARVFCGLAYVQWMDADLRALKLTASQLELQGDERSQAETQDAATYFRAIAQYHENRLAEAAATLHELATNPLVHNGELLVQCLCISAMVYQELGKPEKARVSADRVFEFGMQHHSSQLLHFADSISAELALRQGRTSEALKWATKYDPDPLIPHYNFYEPTMTLAKVLVFDGTDTSRSRAAGLLEALFDYFSRTHNRRFLAEVLALRAMYLDSSGESDAAIHDLETSIKLAQPGRFIRLFVDLGPRLGNLLHNLRLNEDSLAYAGEILAAFREGNTEPGSGKAPILPVTQEAGIDPLSQRELQILALLTGRLSNKEIADKLHISVVTVKRHTANIYQKLSVHSRRQAVAKAAGLGMLDRPG